MPDSLKTILLVDDERDIRLVARMALEKVGGFTVISCASGTEALERAADSGADLVLLDVMMPGMDGPQTLEGLRRIPELADVPVVFMTAKVQNHEVAAYLAMGAAGVVAKPFAPMELPARVREIHEAAQSARERPTPA